MSSEPPALDNSVDGGGHRTLREGRMVASHHPDGEASRLTRRESARQSRKRKKMYLETLEDKVQKLSFEVNRMKEYAATGLSLESLDQETRNNVNQLRTALASDTTPSVELFSLVGTLLVRLGSNGVERRVGIEKDLEQLPELFISPVNMLLFWLNERRIGPFSYGSESGPASRALPDPDSEATKANDSHAQDVEKNWKELEE
ncbi:hypothetical protein FOZ63_027478, partial [Perkinsus olseni]